MKKDDFRENEIKKRKEMRIFLGIVLFLVVINLIFNVNFPHWIWVILFIIACVLSLIQIMDRKLRFIDKRLKDLEEQGGQE